MKKIEKYVSLTGISLFALSLAMLVPAAPSHAGAGNNEDTVSVISAPAPAPAATTPAPAADPAFPPQPVGVAPAEAEVPATVSAAPAAAPSAPETTAPAAPAAASTTTSPSTATLTPVPQADSGAVNGTNVMGDSGFEQKHSGTYYDSEAIVPDSALAKSGATGPRKVDPAYEPGQKFVVVEPGAKATSFEAQYVAATRALKLGRYAAAMEMFEKLYKRDHRDPRVLMGLAVAQQGAGFNESAARSYEDVLKLQPNNADAIVNLMGIMKDQYPSVTLRKLTELRDKYPTNPGIPAQMGLVNAELKNYDDAIRYFEVAASMDPRNASHIFNMAIAEDKKGDVTGAIKSYERALQLDAMYGDVASALPRKDIYDRLVVLRRKV